MRTSNRAKMRSEWLERERRRRQLTIGAWVGAVVVFVGVLAYLTWQQARPKVQPGTAVPVMGAQHIPLGATHEPYNSDPPTSGPHYEQPAEAGFYEQAPADEALVHNLEHGHVIIWYNCSQLAEDACASLKLQVQGVMNQAGVSKNTGTAKLEAVPRTMADAQVALTSWGRLEKLDRFDASAMLAFIQANRDQAPEPLAP
jgi:hypothetical protein